MNERKVPNNGATPAEPSSKATVAIGSLAIVFGISFWLVVVSKNPSTWAGMVLVAATAACTVLTVLRLLRH